MGKTKVPPTVDYANAIRKLMKSDVTQDEYRTLAVTLAVQLWAKEFGLSLDGMGAEELLDFMLEDLENMQ